MRIQGFDFEIVGADERVRKYLDKVDNPLPKGKTYRSLSETLLLWQNRRMNKRFFVSSSTKKPEWFNRKYNDGEIF